MQITKETFYKILNNPELVNNYIFADIENIANNSRFFNSIYLILAKKIQIEKIQNHNIQKKIALNVCDRNILYKLLFHNKTQLSPINFIGISMKKENDVFSYETSHENNSHKRNNDYWRVPYNLNENIKIKSYENNFQIKQTDEYFQNIEKDNFQTKEPEDILSFVDNFDNKYFTESKHAEEQETQKELVEESIVIEILEKKEIEEVDLKQFESVNTDIFFVDLDEIAKLIEIKSKNETFINVHHEKKETESKVQDVLSIGNFEMFDNIEQMFFVEEDTNTEKYNSGIFESIVWNDISLGKSIEISNLLDIERKANNEIEHKRMIEQKESSLDKIEAVIEKKKLKEKYKGYKLLDISKIASSVEKNIMFNINSVNLIAQKIEASLFASSIENKKVSLLSSTNNKIYDDLNKMSEAENDFLKKKEEIEYIKEQLNIYPKEKIERTIELSVKGKTDRSLLNEFIKSEPLLSSIGEIKIKLPNENNYEEYIPKRELLTESLANIYVKQKKYLRAVSIFNDLILKYPEKKHYFAQKINEIENLM